VEAEVAVKMRETDSHDEKVEMEKKVGRSY
jgi:hypothetical protein